MQSRVSFLLVVLAFAATFPGISGAESQNRCAVTKAPEHPFIPPPPNADSASDGSFVLGTPGLWAHVNTHWSLFRTGNKLPFHSEIYSQNKQDNPQHPPMEELERRSFALAVVARRLDASEPLVWSERVSVASGGVMITSLPIPTAGCWEISVRYTPPRDKVQTLTYTVWVEP
jgi:hypothetical protein